jgi:hypothetical protein
MQWRMMLSGGHVMNGHKDTAEWLYCISKKDGNTKVLINAMDDYAFRESCGNRHKDTAEWLCTLDSRYRIKYSDTGAIIPHIRNIKAILLENDIQAIGELLIESKELVKSDENCMVCLDNCSPYWIGLDCAHQVCSGCFVRIDGCPLKCNREFNMSSMKIIKTVS